MTSSTNNHKPLMALALSMALLLAAPLAEAAPARSKSRAAQPVKAARQAAPLRGYVYSPQQAAVALVPPPAIAGAHPVSSVPAGTELTRIAALMRQCESAIATAHPWRAAQAQREMFQLKVSMSYRAAAGRLSPQDMSSAMAIETRAYGNLAATCAPLLV
ncbi:hypothetical protein [Solimonas sp. SE-A11]|uniref:hypothetical protein n=1 Tax=Solimonas sp. SE-A11 TaxID=3054954 RepID=UPI00259CC84E|nr:hypothetical protein [Solimonas sp. SE-A11]MDM4768955.1 hypothetical protein [Solimonas sp. SE-A11]